MLFPAAVQYELLLYFTRHCLINDCLRALYTIYLYVHSQCQGRFRCVKHGMSQYSVPISMLYSFDHAQNVHYPFNPLQPGSMYFKTAHKCESFGIYCERSQIQVNDLIDEAESVGKGANSIISYLHHFWKSM